MTHETKAEQIKRLQGNMAQSKRLSDSDRELLDTLKSKDLLCLYDTCIWEEWHIGVLRTGGGHIYRIHRSYKSDSLTTPAGIKFIANNRGKVVGMVFNDGKQVLAYSSTGVFVVHSISEYAANPMEGLPLTPCKYEDLKPGDFYYADDTEDELSEHSSINVALPEIGGVRLGVFIGADKFPHPDNAEWNLYWKVGKQ